MADRHYDEADGHPLNVPRAGRYHTDAGGTVCGDCAVQDAMKHHLGWNAEKSDLILRKYGYEREPYTPGAEEPDWCIDCGADFMS